MKADAPTQGEYARKRSFAATPEPPPAPVPPREGPLLFVVQKHAARRTHYDFRLELDGMLKSWAVPKGIALDPSEKRLAVPTEDHPFEYASFEGVIPKGQYGAGEVIVWDCGVYAPDAQGRLAFADRGAAEQGVREGIEQGKLSIFLLGQKLKGSFALVRTRDGSWLLFKHRDPFAVSPGVPDDASVLSGLSVEDLQGLQRLPRVPAADLIPHGPRETLPKQVQPMLAQSADAPFSHPDWLYEPKLDGYRIIALLEPGKVKLQSRRGLDLTPVFPEVVEALQAAALAPMVLDGEIVAFDRAGKPSFHALQNRAQLKTPWEIQAARQSHPCIFYCFDLLHFAGMNLCGCPLSARRRYLAQCLLPSRQVQRVPAQAGDGQAFFAAALEAGFEGFVAKKKDSRYEPGLRSQNWLKVKAMQTAEFAIAGYTAGEGGRAPYFGALLLGHWSAAGELVYCSRVGSGFDAAGLKDLRVRMEPLQTGRCPFAEEPKHPPGTVWLRPELVAEIQFAAWSADGSLLAPVFLRLRDDVAPEAAKRRPPVHVEPRQSRAAATEDRRTTAILEQLESRDDRIPLEVGSDRIALSHLNKLYWPEHAGQAAISKRDYLRYLARIGPYLLPHVADRPLSLLRFPEGVQGHSFFQKHWEQPLPEFVETIRVLSKSTAETQEYLLCNNLSTLLWLGQTGTIEFHVWHSRASTHPDVDGAAFSDSAEDIDRSILNYPDYLVFDLDPYLYSGQEAKGEEPQYSVAGFEKAKEVAFWLKDWLDALKLEAFVKTSGKTGLHLFVPLVRSLDFAAVRGLCETFCRHLLRRHPKVITVEWSVDKRTGKIFLDYQMNARTKTLVAAYSPRALPAAPVSMPLTWEALARAQPEDFTLRNVLGRLEQGGDPWAKLLDAKRRIEDAVGTGPAAPEAS